MKVRKCKAGILQKKFIKEEIGLVVIMNQRQVINRYFCIMDLQTRKLHFIESILSIGNEKVIEKLEALLKKEQQKEDHQRISIEQYNQELEEADAAIDRGEYISHKEAVKEIRSWRD